MDLHGNVVWYDKATFHQTYFCPKGTITSWSVGPQSTSPTWSRSGESCLHYKHYVNIYTVRCVIYLFPPVIRCTFCSRSSCRCFCRSSWGSHCTITCLPPATRSSWWWSAQSTRCSLARSQRPSMSQSSLGSACKKMRTKKDNQTQCQE